MERPDLTAVDPAVVAYIEYLEAECIGRENTAASEPAEPPTTVQLISLSQQWHAKRTPRHFYGRQRRGGMGVFDLDCPEDDQPAKLIVADEQDELWAVTNFARVFRLPVSKITPAEVRAKGTPFREALPLHEKEWVVELLPGPAQHIALLTHKGYVFTRNKAYLKDGVILYDTAREQPPIRACWTSGNDDLLVTTTLGNALRFPERQVPKTGCLGIRLDDGDSLFNLVAVQESSGVLLISADGKGTIRHMSGFRANKAPGAGGKQLLKTEKLVGAVPVQEQDDVFIISELGKLIRFRASDIPAKEGLVQGVHCMALRADAAVAVAVAHLETTPDA